MPRKGEVRDLTGQMFGRLTAVRVVGAKHRHAVWLCACACGASAEVVRTALVKGRSTSCGCIHREQLVARNVARATHGRTRSRTYRSWTMMWARCRGTSSDRDLANYKWRGITVCDRWQSFEAFLADMGERPEGTSLDRIDNDGNYEPGNCRWATPKQQAANQRRARVRAKVVLVQPRSAAA